MLWPAINSIFWFDSDNQQTLEAKNLTLGMQPPINLPTHYAWNNISQQLWKCNSDNFRGCFQQIPCDKFAIKLQLLYLKKTE